MTQKVTQPPIIRLRNLIAYYSLPSHYLLSPHCELCLLPTFPYFLLHSSNYH